MTPGLALRFWLVQALTLGRIPLVLAWLAIELTVATSRSGPAFAAALALLIAAALTDLFDGALARRWRVTSRLGAYADPLTDKIYYLATLPALVWLAARDGQDLHARVLLVLAVLFLLRDQWVSFLRSIGSLHGVSAKANWSGKARTLISFPVICVVYYALAAPEGWPLRPAPWLVYALEATGIGINLISVWVYTRDYWPWLKAEARPGD